VSIRDSRSTLRAIVRYIYLYIIIVITIIIDLSVLVVRVPGYRFRDRGSIPGIRLLYFVHGLGP
jgi:hypothetical protein